jgi:molybdate transport system ATP-binding protein
MTVALAFTVSRGAFTLSMSAELEPGTVVAILGPNGAGKSTLVRAIAGLQPIDSGSIRINSQVVDDGDRTLVPARERAVGVVFQDYALFPHLSVVDNVAFGPRSRGAGRSQATMTARATLARLGISELAERKPGEISGGQQQRAALARALATSPDVLLLDEPLAALDVETKETVRAELQSQLDAFPGCTVLITHDPLDALLLADRVIVLEGGAVVQDGTPADLSQRPLTDYVATLMGVTLIRGDATDGVLVIDGGGRLSIADHDLSGPALAVVRPESVTLHRVHPEGSARNVWQGIVSSLQPSHDRIRVFVDGQPSVVAAVTPEAAAEMRLAKGSQVWLSLKSLDLRVYPGRPAHR